MSELTLRARADADYMWDFATELQKVVGDIKNGEESGVLRDFNGQQVGEWKITSNG